VLEDKGGDAAATLRATLGTAFKELNNTQRDLLLKAGLGLEDIAKIVEGRTVPAVDDLKASYDAVYAINESIGQSGEAVHSKATRAALEQTGLTKSQAQAMQDQARAYAEVNRLTTDQGTALGGAIDKWRDLQRLTGQPLTPKIDTSTIERQLREMTTSYLTFFGLASGGTSPSRVAAAQQIDYRRQGPR